MAGRYVACTHFRERLTERAVSMLDVGTAIVRATAAERYKEQVARQGGTCWRIFGPDVEGERILGIGIETFLYRKRKRMMLVTVFGVNPRPGGDK